MKTIMLSTSSNETSKYAHSFECGIGGGKVDIFRYDTEEVTEGALYNSVKEAAPDFIIYIGSAWGRQPAIATLARINANIAPMVHLCSDAADPPWFPLLREYAEKGCFALQVAIDGNDNWPGSAQGLTLLTPVDPATYTAIVAHGVRSIACGYGGNPGSPEGKRRAILWECMTNNLLTVRLRDGGGETYQDYCDFLLRSRMSLNIPYTGTEQKMHVKGRVVESGLAGACLLEVADSPAKRWFSPGVDYLEYASIDQLREYIRTYTVRHDDTQRLGESLRDKVLGEHTPAIFWSKILDRIGLRMAA